MADDSASRLFQAFVSLDPPAAIAVIESARSAGVPQDELFDRIFTPALSVLGGEWASGAIDEYTFTQAAVVADQVASFVIPPRTAPDTDVTVVIGTMQGDEHTVRKNIFASTLKEAGYRVLDLGTEARPSEFLERLEETGGRIVLVFAEMLSTALDVARVREMFVAAGRDDVLVFVAGSPFSADAGLARSVGANGVARSAEGALRLLAEAARRTGGSE